MLEVRDVSVRYGETAALDAVGLAVAGHETVAVLGPSGSGKTTLLKVAAGLVTPDSGEVLWKGRDLAAVPAHRRRFGLVFQDHALFPHLDVAGNIAFGLRMLDLPTGEIEKRVGDALEAVGLSGLGGRRIDELSGGQAQRVALARTIAPEPRMLLLDEPLGSLDPALRGDLADDLAAMLRLREIPALLVTHDTEEAFALAAEIAVLDSGKIVRQGTPGELWSDPGTAGVARLLGHTVIPLDGKATPLTAALGSLTGERPAALQPGALRTDDDGELEGRVVAVSFRGPGYVATVIIDGFRLSVPADSPPEVGSVDRYRLQPESVVAIDM